MKHVRSSWVLLLPVLACRLWADLAPSKPYNGGEDLLFAIRWGAVTGGYSSLSVQEINIVGGHPAYHIVSEAHSTGLVNSLYPVKDRNEAWLDTETPRALRYEKNVHEGNYRVHQIVDLNQDTHRFREQEYRLDKETFEQKEGTIPPNVFDVLSSLYYIRSETLEVGKSFTIDVHSGEKTYPLVVIVKKRERVKVRAGNFDCFCVEPVLRGPGIFVAKGKKLEVWMTADSRHMPVLMRSEVIIGHVSAELVSFREDTGLRETATAIATSISPSSAYTF